QWGLAVVAGGDMAARAARLLIEHDPSAPCRWRHGLAVPAAKPVERRRRRYQRALERSQRLGHMARGDRLACGCAKCRCQRRWIMRVSPQPIKQFAFGPEPVLDLVEQRIERLVLQMVPPAVPEQRMLAPDLEQARRVARAGPASDPDRARSPVRVGALGLMT